MMNSATATGIETSNGSAAHSVSQRNGHDITKRESQNHQKEEATTKQPSKPNQKYRHVAAVHSKKRSSCLSHDSDEAPSFLGFRNLMVIVLGMSQLALRGLCKVFVH